MKKQGKKRRKYWIYYVWSECGVCGKQNNARLRIYEDEEPKPTDESKRHVYELFCCPEHYLQE